MRVSAVTNCLLLNICSNKRAVTCLILGLGKIGAANLPCLLLFTCASSDMPLMWGVWWPLTRQRMFVCFTITEGKKLAKGLNWVVAWKAKRCIDVFCIINEEAISHPSRGWCCRRGRCADFYRLPSFSSSPWLLHVAGGVEGSVIFSLGFACFVMWVWQRVPYRCYWHSVHLQIQVISFCFGCKYGGGHTANWSLLASLCKAHMIILWDPGHSDLLTHCTLIRDSQRRR